MELFSTEAKHQTLHDEVIDFKISNFNLSTTFNNFEHFYNYDYELRNTSNNQINSQVPNTNDSIDIKTVNETENNVFYKANCFKYLFFDNNIKRYQTDYFDLDLSFITNKVVAMSNPATGLKALFHNSVKDVKNFLGRYYRNYKIYNLTSDKNKIYQKSCFNNKSLTVFPFPDDKPCPIQLMLDFCIDIVLYLSNNDGAAVIHCDDGLEKTGTFICCYLIFTGLCNNVNDAVNLFNERRCVNGFKAISMHHINYIRFFEIYLKLNFESPYIDALNILQNDDVVRENNEKVIKFNYNNNIIYPNENEFYLKNVLVGPFEKDSRFSFVFSTNSKSSVDNFFPNSYISKEYKDNNWYFRIMIPSQRSISFDLMMEMENSSMKFVVWINFFYATMKIIYKQLEELKVKLNDKVPIPFNFDINLNEIFEQVSKLFKEKGRDFINKDQISFVFEKDELDLIKDDSTQNSFKVEFNYCLG